MKATTVIVDGARVVLTQDKYVAAGGEATIYKHNNRALRVYHDASAMPPQARLQELGQIKSKKVIKPIGIISDAASGVPLGFSMDFVPSAEPLCRFFTALFKKTNNIDPGTIRKMVLDIQETVGQLIAEGFLPVDLNELNILAKLQEYIPYFIDIASWATPSFPATAIMDSIRDPAVQGNAFTAGSTWYSFGVLATQLYLGIHPFHGLHPVHKMDWRKRMKLNASIFEKEVRVPPVVPPFSSIPKEHLEWLKRLFSNSTFREPPPVPGALPPLSVPTAATRVVRASGRFSVTNTYKLPEPVIDIHSNFGQTYAVTTKHVYRLAGQDVIPILDRSKYQQVLLAQPAADTITLALISNSEAEFYLYTPVGGRLVLLDKQDVVSGIFVRNERFYSAVGTQFLEHEVLLFGSNGVHTTKHIDNVSHLTAKFFDGVVYQDLFGKAWLTIPYAAGVTVSKAVPELDGYRVIDAKMVRSICALIVERSGVYTEFILAFDSKFESYTVRQVQDQRELNFTVTPNDICVMLIGSTLELFKNPTAAKVVENPPIDESTRLLMLPNGVCFIDGDEIQKLSVT